jgi:histone H3/H4
VQDKEVLVIASRLKAYVRQRSGDMSTSAEALEVLSDLIRQQCDDAIRRARMDGRRTVKGRDFKP